MTREKRRRYSSPYTTYLKEQQRERDDMAAYKHDLHAFWNKEGTVRPTSYKMPFKHKRSWRNALDIDYWTDARSRSGQALQTETDKLFTSAYEDAVHPDVFVTLGLCKMLLFRALTQEGEQIYKLFSATYWDELGHYLTSLNQSEQDLEVNHDNLRQCAAVSLQRIHHYCLEAVNSSYTITQAMPGLPDSYAPTILDEEDD
jgi:hypothetical protein